MKCTLPSSLVSEYGIFALFMNMILLRFLIVSFLRYVNLLNYFLNIAE